MNSSSKTIITMNGAKSAMIEQVYSIIDSKIQYADYLTNQAIQPFVDKDTIKGGASFSRRPATPKEAAASLEHSFLNQIEKTSKAKRLLLIIRTQLCSENATACFHLLTDNRYLDYSDKVLKRVLEEALMANLK